MTKKYVHIINVLMLVKDATLCGKGIHICLVLRDGGFIAHKDLTAPQMHTLKVTVLFKR